MNWNILLKRSNKEITEQKEKKRTELRKNFNDWNKYLKQLVKDIKKEETLLYRIKDRFSKVYPIFLGAFIVWTLPIIFFILKGTKNPLNFLLMVLYLILTIPIGFLSLTIPTIKFFAFDLPKITNEAKIYLSSSYIVALIFGHNRTIFPILKKLDNNGQFKYKGGDYLTEKETSFISTGRIIVSFYLEGIPNPLKFDFVSYLEKYIKAKTKDKKAKVVDWENKLVDVAFSSESLREFKKNKIFSEFFRDQLGEVNKMLFAILGVMGLVVVAFLIVYIMKP